MAASSGRRLNQTGDRLKVFISYSRSDMSAADAVVAALETNDIDVTIDRRDLPYGEEWQTELADFIRASDTVIWLVSSNSVRSKWCKWELGEVIRLKKRLVPIVVGEISADDLPEVLGRIHILPAEGEFSLEQHLPVLLDALNTDREWVKEHTRLSDRARQWITKERSPALLLRGTALKDAEAWSDRTPKDAPSPSDDILELMFASRRAAARRQRNWVSGITVVTTVLAVLVFIASWQWQIAETNADQARSTLAFSDFSKASEQAGTAPTKALAHLARAIRNDPKNSAVGRRALYLLAEHTHVLPIIDPSSELPPLVTPRALTANTRSDGTPLAAELMSPDATWLLKIAGESGENVSIRNKDDGRWQTIMDQGYLAIRMAVFAENSSFVAVSAGGGGEYGFSGKVKIIDRNGDVLAEQSYDGVTAERLALSPNGRVMVVTLASYDDKDGQSRTIIYDLPVIRSGEGDRVIELGISELRVIPGQVKHIGFSADGKHLVLDGQWLSILQSMRDEPFPHSEPNVVTFSPDSSYMAVGDRDEKWTVHDASTGSKLSDKAAKGVDFGQQLPGLIRTSVGEEGVSIFHDDNQVFRVDDPRVILIGVNDAVDKLLLIRDDGTGQVVRISDDGFGANRQLVSRLYGLSTQTVRWIRRNAGEAQRADSRTNFIVVTGGAATSWRLLYVAKTPDDATLDRVLKTLASNNRGSANTIVALHPGGRPAAIAEIGHSRIVVNVIDVLTNDPILNPFVINDQYVDLFFSHDGDWLAAASSNSGTALGKFHLIDMGTGLPLIRPRYYAGPFVVRPDGKRVAVLGGGGDGEPYLFDVLGDQTPVPLWAADLAEGIAGWRMDERNVLRALTPDEQDERIKKVTDLVRKQSNATDRWMQFARWYLLGDADPTISPYSHMRRSILSERIARSQAGTFPVPAWAPPQLLPSVESNNIPTGTLGNVPTPAVSGSTPPPASDAPSSTGGFVSVIGSMETQEGALNLAADVQARAALALESRNVSVMEKMLGGKRYFRVIIEPSSSRAQAEYVCSQLRNIGFTDCFLAAHR